jgi:hypothetical protein
LYCDTNVILVQIRGRIGMALPGLPVYWRQCTSNFAFLSIYSRYFAKIQRKGHIIKCGCLYCSFLSINKQNLAHTITVLLYYYTITVDAKDWAEMKKIKNFVRLVLGPVFTVLSWNDLQCTVRNNYLQLGIFIIWYKKE